jgi:hypothetical protein
MEKRQEDLLKELAGSALEMAEKGLIGAAQQDLMRIYELCAGKQHNLWNSKEDTGLIAKCLLLVFHFAEFETEDGTLRAGMDAYAHFYKHYELSGRDMPALRDLAVAAYYCWECLVQPITDIYMASSAAPEKHRQPAQTMARRIASIIPYALTVKLQDRSNEWGSDEVLNEIIEEAEDENEKISEKMLEEALRVSSLCFQLISKQNSYAC